MTSKEIDPEVQKIVDDVLAGWREDLIRILGRSNKPHKFVTDTGSGIKACLYCGRADMRSARLDGCQGANP